MTQMRLEMNDEATETFDKLIETYPQSKYVKSAEQNKEIISKYMNNKDSMIENALKQAAPAIASEAYNEAIAKVGMLTDIQGNGIFNRSQNKTQEQKPEEIKEAEAQEKKIVIFKAIIFLLSLAFLIFFAVYLIIKYRRKNDNTTRKHH
jgi:lipopolysaccharide export LptBFGC system permease protein LptF